MFKHSIRKLPKSTVEIIVDLPQSLIKEEYKTAFSTLLKNLEIQGFRKGKVPQTVGEKHLKREQVYEELIRSYLPKIYQEIVAKENLKPILSPKIELLKAKENEDWQIKITIAEKPMIELGNYQEVIKKIKAEQKKDDIWIPGQKVAQKELTEQEKSKKQQDLLNAILGGILKEVKCEIPDLIIEEELNQRLANLLTEIQKIGLTVDSYLKSKNLTQDALKKRYRDEIEQTYRLEFILAELAEKANIKVENQDLEKLFSSIKDPKERETAQANSYFYASVLRKQKTLDYLLGS